MSGRSAIPSFIPQSFYCGATKRFHGLFALAAISLTNFVPPAFGQKSCEPSLTISSPKMSDMRGSVRTWSAAVTANASACSNKSGRFSIEFTRLLEFGPDVNFVEQFEWVEGTSRIELEFSPYEAVQRHQIRHVEPCSCRQ